MRRMTGYLVIALLAGLIVIGGQAVMAQGAGCGRHGWGHGHRMGHALGLTTAQRQQARAIGKETRERMQKVLTPEQQQALKDMHKQRPQLTAEQQSKLQAIRTDARSKAKAIRDNTALTDQQKREQFQALHQATRTQIRQVLPSCADRLKLTPAQRDQMKAIREDARAKFRAILTPDQQAKLDAMHAQHAGQQPAATTTPQAAPAK